MSTDNKYPRGICRVKVLVFPGSVLSEETHLQAELNGREMTLTRIGDVVLHEHEGVWPADTTRTVFTSDPIEVFGDEFTLLIAPTDAHKRKITSPEVIHKAWSPRGRHAAKAAAAKNWDFSSEALPVDYVNWFTALENFRFTLDNLRKMVACAGVMKGEIDVSESVPDPLMPGKKCLMIGDANTPVTILLELC